MNGVIWLRPTCKHLLPTYPRVTTCNLLLPAMWFTCNRLYISPETYIDPRRKPSCYSDCDVLRWPTFNVTTIEYKTKHQLSAAVQSDSRPPAGRLAGRAVCLNAGKCKWTLNQRRWFNVHSLGCRLMCPGRRVESLRFSAHVAADLSPLHGLCLGFSNSSSSAGLLSIFARKKSLPKPIPLLLL